MKHPLKIFTLILILFKPASVFCSESVKTKQWGFFEISLSGPRSGNPFLDVSLEATFRNGKKAIKAHGFYDGAGVYKVRFMPDIMGQWSYKTKSNVPALDGVTGSFTCIEPPDDQHGPVRVANTFHFKYADGKAFSPVGTTLYCWQMERYEETLATLKNADINKVRFMPFPHSGNTFPPFKPWKGSSNDWDFDRPNPEFWRFMEQAVIELGERGVQADFIFFHPYESGGRQNWGLGPEQMTETQRVNYLSYAVRRLAAYNNVWWSMANEYDLIDKRLSYWELLAETVAMNDPYGHMHSIHGLPGNHYPGWSHSWVSHISIQDPEVSKISEWRKQYQKPVIDDEYQYDGNIAPWGQLSEEEATQRIWTATIEGGYATHGESYQPYNFFWKGGTPQRRSFSKVSWLSKEVLNNDSKPIPGGLNPLDDVSASSGETFYLYYYGNEFCNEKSFSMPKGIEYRVDVIDTWNMTVNELDEIYSGDFIISWPSNKYMAVRIIKNK